MLASAGAVLRVPTESIRARFGSWRVAAFVVSCSLAAAFIAYLTISVPVHISMLEEDRARYWPAAAAAATIILAADVVLGVAARRRHTSVPSTGLYERDPLSFEVVPARAICASVAVSSLLVIAAAVENLPTWAIVLAALFPWLPVFVVEGIAKYRRYGVYVFFVMVALLQVGHLGEHTAQVSQLIMTGGDLDRSHGVFGRLDFETVHFFWDTAIWLTTCAVVFKFSRNPWLWTSFAFASLHEIEHLYLYWLYLVHGEFYLQGGLAGIMGHGGVIGSPLPRPYLHFMYNFLITVPMLIGLRQQTHWTDPASPKSAGSAQPLIQFTVRSSNP